MTGCATLEAGFKQDNQNILVDLTFEKKKGCIWNPLNLLGSGGQKSGRELNASEREQLQKRVKQLEKRLCYITEKIDKCEQSKQEDVDEHGAVKAEVSEQRPPATTEESENWKVTQNYMVLLKQQQRLKKHRREGGLSVERSAHPRGRREKRRKPLSPESKSGMWENKTNLETKSAVWGECKANHWENKSAAWEKSNIWDGQSAAPEKKCYTKKVEESSMQTNVGDFKPWSDIRPPDPVKTDNRTFSDEPVTKKNIKTIIDEAVVDSIGKTLQKYFKDGLDSYIKKRVESAVNIYNDVDRVTCFTSRTAPGFSTRPPPDTNNSFEELHNFKTTIKTPNEVFSDVAKECSTKTLSSTVINPGMEGKGFYSRSKLAPKTHLTLKYGEVRSWAKAEGLKPVSAPTYLKDMLGNQAQTVESKTIQILKGHPIKPFPSDRNLQRKFFRRKISKEDTIS